MLGPTNPMTLAVAQVGLRKAGLLRPRFRFRVLLSDTAELPYAEEALYFMYSGQIRTHLTV
jgi:hypothetical protein